MEGTPIILEGIKKTPVGIAMSSGRNMKISGRNAKNSGRNAKKTKFITDPTEYFSVPTEAGAVPLLIFNDPIMRLFKPTAFSGVPIEKRHVQ